MSTEEKHLMAFYPRGTRFEVKTCLWCEKVRMIPKEDGVCGKCVEARLMDSVRRRNDLTLRGGLR